YASYSGVSYYQKLSVVEEISTPVPDQAEIENYEKQKKLQGEKVSQDWVIIPKHERPKPGEFFGVLQIPKINLQVSVFEGTYEQELAKGVGHYRRSVFPGEPDNAVLSGHRDTVFRRLGELK